jgi:hypothetical protein
MSSRLPNAASTPAFINCDSPIVERYHRSYNQECLQIERPGTIDEVRAVTAAYTRHYNEERPNQALSCRNRPPRVAFPSLPPRPSIPLCVDPDAWLGAIHGRAYLRRVGESGCVVVGTDSYYIQRELVGQHVALQVDAAAREFVVVHHGSEVRRLPFKGLVRTILPFDTFVDHVAKKLPRLAGGARSRRQARQCRLQRLFLPTYEGPRTRWGHFRINLHEHTRSR